MANTSNTKRPGHDAGPPHKSITFAQLQELADDPARDLSGGRDIRALLTFEPATGFHLMARDGDTVYQVSGEGAKGVRFRTIEMALAVLQEVPGLAPDIGIFIAAD